MVGDFLVFHKEALPHITNSGKRKIRMAFFECSVHPKKFYLVSIDGAKNTQRSNCLCDAEFNKDKIHEAMSSKLVEAYSYAKRKAWLTQATKDTPPGWFWVSRIGAFLRKEDGSNLMFYKFEKTDRSGADYKTARRIEDITWNRPKDNKAFYLMRMSHELDALHAEGLITFKSDLWNRGTGIEFFKTFLDENIHSR